MRILVLGASGQLGKCLHDQLSQLNLKAYFKSKKDLDLLHYDDIKGIVKEMNPNIIINASAYTKVDEAENNIDLANKVNNLAVANLSNVCFENNSTLIHVSTDYVFDGNAKQPYTSNSKTNPTGIYGKTKLKGEIKIAKSGCNYIIIRTAWLYSEYNNNFLKTILHLASTKDEISVIYDQIGTPTYAQDLAKAIVSTFTTIKSVDTIKDLYHYSGDEVCSWYEFATKILKIAESIGLQSSPKIKKIKSKEYITLTKRPKYSVLDSSNFYKKFNVAPSNLENGIKKSILALAN